MTVDLHLHSRFSHDSDELQENYIRQALSRGESVLGFSEHYDYDAVLQGDNLPLPDCAAYAENLADLQKKYPEITILRGIELGYSESAKSRYEQLLAQNAFDYAILSVHSLPQYGDFYHGRAFIGRSAKEAYADYFNAVYESVDSGLDYQIIGHIGYCARYCRLENSEIRYEDFSEIIDKILISIIRLGKCLEINTSTGGKGGFLPDKSIIDRYLQLGGSVFSFASDAHTADKYLRGKDEVTAWLKSKGVNYLYYFRERQPVRYKI